MRIVVYPIRPKEQKEPGERCPCCERKYTKKRKPVLTIVGYGTTDPFFDWECEDCAKETVKYVSNSGVHDY